MSAQVNIDWARLERAAASHAPIGWMSIGGALGVSISGAVSRSGYEEWTVEVCYRSTGETSRRRARRSARRHVWVKGATAREAAENAIAFFERGRGGPHVTATLPGGAR